LQRYDLAVETEPGIWTLSEKLESTLRGLGERNDIVKAMNRALAERGQQRSLETFQMHGEEVKTTVVGRVIDKRLIDELGDRLGIVIDGIDARVHHIVLRDATAAQEAKIGAIVEIGRAPSLRPADHNIAVDRALLTRAQNLAAVGRTVILAALTSLPNLWVALHFARTDRGTALFSAAMNSNSINLIGGLIVPALFAGTAAARGALGPFVLLLTLTLAATLMPLPRGRLERLPAALIVAPYLVFAALTVARG